MYILYNIIYIRTEGADYIGTTGSVTFAPGGEVIRRFTISIINDQETETDEQLIVMFSSAVPVQDLPVVMVITVDDDMGEWVVSKKSMTCALSMVQS